jgi:hypothetical protein
VKHKFNILFFLPVFLLLAENVACKQAAISMTTAKNFVLYDAMHYSGKIDLTSIGFSRINLFYESSLTKADPTNSSKLILDMDAINVAATAANYSNSVVCTDIEQWFTDSSVSGTEMANRFTTMFDAFRSKIANVQIGNYGIAPSALCVSRFYDNGASSETTLISNWKTSNVKRWTAAGTVDYFAPPVYICQPNITQWISDLVTTVNEIKTHDATKKIIVFIWPQYYDKPGSAYYKQFINTSIWQQMLEAVYANCDGAIIWSSNTDENENIVTWDDSRVQAMMGVTKTFIAEHNIVSINSQPLPSPVVTTLWENGATAGKLPIWFSTTSSKTYGIGSGNGHVYVASRDGADGRNIFVYNAATGDSVADLNTSGITGGSLVLSDVNVTEDGKIIAASMGTTTAFNVYMYNSETASPTAVLNIPGTIPGGRTGDLFTVTGNYSKGTAKIWTASATVPSQIWVLEMENGAWKTSRRLVTTMPTSITGASLACVAPKPDGSIYWKAGSQSLWLINADATVNTVSNKLSTYADENSIKYLGYSSTYNLDYVASFAYRTDECAEIISLTPGDLSTCKMIARTPCLGLNANVGGLGDVDVRYDANINPILYVVAANNGFGAYKVEGLAIDQTTGVRSVVEDKNLRIFPNPATGVVNISEMATSIKLLSMSGQLVKEAFMTKAISLEGLQGVYLIQIESQNGKVTKRLIIK